MRTVRLRERRKDREEKKMPIFFFFFLIVFFSRFPKVYEALIIATDMIHNKVQGSRGSISKRVFLVTDAGNAIQKDEDFAEAMKTAGIGLSVMLARIDLGLDPFLGENIF